MGRVFDASGQELFTADPKGKADGQVAGLMYLLERVFAIAAAAAVAVPVASILAWLGMESAALGRQDEP